MGDGTVKVIAGQGTCRHVVSPTVVASMQQ